MPPHEGLVHLKEYDIKDSNVELIGSDLDHKVKYNSAASEPAWNDGKVGQTAGLFIWRIEDFEVVAWPREKYGQFYNGDSYIVLYTYKVGSKNDPEKLGHDIFFWLGSKTSQDEAGVAAYKTVELDEFLKGAATQHREVQQQPSDQFVSLFPRLSVLSGGVKSGFRHVDLDDKPKHITTLLRIFKRPSAGRDSTIVHEVEPTWQSLDDDDVFVLDTGEKIWVWQGKKCSPMEKAKAAQVVHDMTIAKHVNVEVVGQNDARGRVIISLLGGSEVDTNTFKAGRPIPTTKGQTAESKPSETRKLFRLSDASGSLTFALVKQGQPIQKSDFDSNDVFLLDTGEIVWIWEGQGASNAEKKMWLRVAQGYISQHTEDDGNGAGYATPYAKVNDGWESPAFLRILA
jgi:gelsolin